MDERERLGVIGDPIGHSLSPEMHTAALAAAGLDWTYEAFHVRADELADWYETVGRTLRGFNVTIPHKVAMVPLAHDLDPVARAFGAVNTIVREEGGQVGYNTDPAGFLGALSAAGFDPAGAEVVIFGAGGAARGLLFALRPLVRRITVASWSPEKAQRLVPAEDAMAQGDPALRTRLWETDLLINATPLGMPHHPGESPLPPHVELRPDTFVFDLVYGQDTPFLATAGEFGCRSQNGLEMLIQQGAQSFRLWTGLEPDIEVMRQACRERLESSTC